MRSPNNGKFEVSVTATSEPHGKLFTIRAQGTSGGCHITLSTEEKQRTKAREESKQQNPEELQEKIEKLMLLFKKYFELESLRLEIYSAIQWIFGTIMVEISDFECHSDRREHLTVSFYLDRFSDEKLQKLLGTLGMHFNLDSKATPQVGDRGQVTLSLTRHP